MTPITTEYSQLLKWDNEYQVLTDQMGILLPIEDIRLLLELCKQHVGAHSPLEREAIGRRTVERLGKGTTNQFNFDYFKEGSNDVIGTE